MIKAKISDGSVLLGLSDENLRRLKDGSPIVLDLAEIDMPPLKITNMAGATPESILSMLRKTGMVTPATRMLGEGGSGEEN